MELSPDGCNYGLFNTRSKSIDVLRSLAFDEFDYESGLATVLDQLKEHSFEKVAVGAMFQEALLVPKEFQSSADALLPLLFERQRCVFVHDVLSEWQLVNMYALPQRLYQAVKDRFPNALFLHNYTASLKNNPETDSHISLHFSKQYFRVMLQKDRQLKLAQIYRYQTGMDVSYYLLKMCSVFELQQQDTLIYVSGVIKAEESVYEDLKSFFPNIIFSRLPSWHKADETGRQVAFSSLYNLASCVL